MSFKLNRISLKQGENPAFTDSIRIAILYKYYTNASKVPTYSIVS